MIVERVALAGLVIAAVACKRSSHFDDVAPNPGPSKVVTPSLPADVLAKANARIEARQRAIKAWRTVSLDGSAPCTQAPPAPALDVNGFKTGTTDAQKTMTMLTAAEIDNKPDPSLPPDLAADLATVAAAGRGAPAPDGWSEIDYTTNEFPFQAGPIAKTYQYEVRKLSMGMSTESPPSLPRLLAGKELVLVIEHQVRPEVDREAQRYTPGEVQGVALLWSYDDGAVVCSGRFDVTNQAAKFVATAGQISGLPDEELQLLAYRDATAKLHGLAKAP